MCKKLFYFVLVLGLALTNTTNAELVGWWKFDDGSGSTVVDSSGNGYDGTVYGNAQWVDGTLQFDGADDYVDLPIGTLISSLTNSSFLVWVDFFNTGGAWQRIWDFGSGTQINMFLTPRIGTADEMRFAITETGYTDEDQTTAPDTLASGWHHVALVIDIDNNAHRLYLDGELVAENTEARYSPSTLGETTQNWIGRSQYAADGYFVGSVDDFQIYNHAMSANEIRTITIENFQQAWEPRPVEGEVDVLLDRKLVWNPGIASRDTFELYSEHQIYFGTDFDDVNTATVPMATVTDANEYSIPLDYDTTYCWRVDEVSSLDPDNPVKGEVWSFTAANYIVVEDFEDYNDYEPDTIYLTWIDGWDDPQNGSTSGYPNPIFGIGEHYMETTIVHGGAQSMPLFYDNSAGLSEVTKTLNADWTQDDVVALTLFYHGDAGNEVEPMYVALDGSAVVTNEDPRAVLVNDWIQWNIPLQEFADQGVSLDNVSTLSIGLGNKAAPQAGGGSGHVFIDDIRLYRALPEETEPGPEPLDPGTDNLVVYYAFENSTEDNSGNGYDATASSNPQYVSGPTGYGMAIDFDGANDYVRLPIGSALASMSDITVATWANFSNLGGGWQRIWDFGNDTEINMFVTPRMGTDGALRFAITIAGSGAESNITASATLPTGWHHVAAVIDSASMTMKLYEDGRLVAEGPTAVLPSDLGETTENFLGRSQYAADAYYFGSLDEFRIYDRALSDEEILFLAGR
jgi:hypothetical protein